MSQNALEIVLKTCENFAQCIQTHFSQFIVGDAHRSLQENPSKTHQAIFSIFSKPAIISDDIQPSKQGSSSDSSSFTKVLSAKPVSKEELGRSTWTFLHTLAAQFPDHPTKQQRRDVKELMIVLSRLYPCKECADHFKEVLKANPVQAGSQAELSQWLCHVHNVVNRSLGKHVFPCERVDARWGKLDCEDRACDLQGTVTNFSK